MGAAFQSITNILCIRCLCTALTHLCPSLCDAMNCSSSGSQFSRQEYWSELLWPPLGILLVQGLNSGLPHCGQIFYCLSHQGSPVICQVTLKCKQQNKTEKAKGGTSLAVHWLRLHASSAVGLRSVLAQGTKIPHAV